MPSGQTRWNLVTRAEIQSALWSGETFVDIEGGLNYCIRQIRSVLGDNAEQPAFIATVPRRCYRFIAEVQPLVAPAPLVGNHTVSQGIAGKASGERHA